MQVKELKAELLELSGGVGTAEPAWWVADWSYWNRYMLKGDLLDAVRAATAAKLAAEAAAVP